MPGALPNRNIIMTRETEKTEEVFFVFLVIYIL